MAIPAGTRLSHFEIVETLGRGGMGEVYKARDTRLNRTVAIKVLSPDTRTDATARERLEREARAVSALNHPHICTLYDVGREDATDFLVMEYVDGEPLSERLSRGPLPLPQALRYATELASALDRAHRAGVVHRDMKPANVMITRSGTKLLDFGLAKAAAPTSIGTIDATGSVSELTRSGVIVGTVQYMAPEQVEGRQVDARTDIFTFGAVLYEMVSGRKAFEGASVGSVFAAILDKHPPLLATVQPLAPTGLDRIVSTCLEKDPDDRWQSARDLMRELQWLASPDTSEVDAAKPPARLRPRAVTVAGVSIGIAALIAATVLIGPRLMAPAPPSRDVRFSVYAEPGSHFTTSASSVVTPQFALSPDGTQLAYAASSGGRSMLWVRPLNALHGRVLPGTEDAEYPFWSSDSSSIAFFAQGKIKSLNPATGAPIVRGEASRDPRGGTWAADGTIVTTPHSFGGVVFMPPQGELQSPLTVNRSEGESNHRWPVLLPDGRHLVYVVRSSNRSLRGVTLAARGDTRGTRLVEADHAAAVADDHLLFIRGRTLMAQPLDLAGRQLTGEAVAIVDNVGANSTGHAALSVSRNSTLAYAEAWPAQGELLWLTRDGRRTGAAVAPLADYVSFSLSPDETRLALSTVDPQTATPDVWLLDLSRGLQQRFTVDPMTDANAFWSPDGTRIVFRSNRTGVNRLYSRGVHDSKSEELLDVAADGSLMANMIITDLSRDGAHLLLTNTGHATSFDIMRLATGNTREVTRVVQTEFDEYHAVVSPDNQWMAYVSNETGRPQIYVQSYPDGKLRHQISSQGGTEPQWRRDGKELFFIAPDYTFMSVNISTQSPFKAGAPTPLFRVRTPVSANPYRQQYVVSADGQRFLVNKAPDNVPPPAIHVVLDWRVLLPKH